MSAIPSPAASSQPLRASLFNLIAYLPDAKAPCSSVQGVVRSVIQNLPARTISITVDEGLQPPLTVQSTPHILERGTSRIACDEIAIQVSPEALAKVPFALMPYLIPDVPIYLLWGQNPLVDKVILPHLQSFATRLIFDAGDWQHVGDAMLQQFDDCKFEIMDINWAMIGAWRDAFARLFRTSEAVEQLRCSRRLCLTYNGSSVAHATQSIYLCSWLAAQLGWSLGSLRILPDGLMVNYSHSRGAVDVAIIYRPEYTCDVGTLLDVDIETYEGVFYALIRNIQGRTATVHISRRDSCDLPFTLPLPALQRGLNYIRELFHSASSSHYRKMIRLLAGTVATAK